MKLLTSTFLPFSPLNATIISLIAKNNQELKVELLQIPTMDVLLDKEKSPLMVAMQRTAVSLAKCYAGEQRKLLLPEIP